MIGETLNDVTFKYLFVKEFQWIDPQYSEMYQGHPRPGSVYRAIYGKNTNNYKLIIGPSSMLMMDKLVVTEDENHLCTSNVVEVTKQNIIQLGLAESELDKLLAWMSTNNRDLKELYQPIPANIQQGLSNLKLAMSAQQDEESKALAKADRVMGGVYITNPIVFDLLLEVADALYQYDLMRHDSNTLSLTLGTEGKGINCHQALESIYEYLSPVREGGDDRASIKETIIHMFTELQRRVLNDLDK